MAENGREYYYVSGKKVSLQRIPDSFAVKYKKDITSRAMEGRLAEMPELALAEERKELPRYRFIIVTLPPSQRLSVIEDSKKSLVDDSNVEFVTPVYRERQSGLRLVLTDEITVRFKDSTSQREIENINEKNNVEVIEQNRFVPQQYLLRVKNPQDTLTIANKYQESDLTEFAEPNFISEIEKARLPSDEFFTEQWHLHNTGQTRGETGEDVSAEEAWEISQGSSDITIAIIDDGVDIDHPDLKENIWKNPDTSASDVHGWNFYDDNSNPRPQKFTPPYHRLAGNDSHGTPCAGVAAARGENTIGVVGIAYRCRILPVKIFLADDLVPYNVLADAIRYAGQKADVLSNSWSGAPSSNVEQAIKDVVRTGRGGKGCPVFVATGNSYHSSIGFPSSVPEAIAVGASTNLARRASYSNYGEGIDFVAPSSGGTMGIFTTDVSINGRGFNVGDINSGDAEGLYTNSFGGTSSATPLAAGIAALILSLNTKLRWDQVRKYMQDNADKIEQTLGNYVNGYSLEYGYGRVNAFKTLKAVKNDMNGKPENIIEKVVTPSLAIPDNNMEGITSTIVIDEDGTIETIKELSVNITHTYRGDLLVSLITPDNKVIDLHKGLGGGADNLIEAYNTGTTAALKQLEGKSVKGQWQLKVIDRWAQDTGKLISWGLKIRLHSNMIRHSLSPGMSIPDNDQKGIESILDFPEQGQIKDIKVSVDISHTYIGDLRVKLIAPSNKEVILHNKTGGGKDNLQAEYTVSSHPQLNDFVGEEISGQWKLAVADLQGYDKGKLNLWEIEVRI